MLKVECRYLAKLELIENLLHAIENDDNITSIDDIAIKLKRSRLFYRNQLAKLEM